MSSSNRRGSASERSLEAEGLGSVLDRLSVQRPLRGGLTLGVLARRWEEVVGERLAAECRPVALHGGVLVVQASSQAWGAQLRFLAEEIRTEAERVVGPGVVDGVRVAGGGGERGRGRRR